MKNNFRDSRTNFYKSENSLRTIASDNFFKNYKESIENRKKYQALQSGIQLQTDRIEYLKSITDEFNSMINHLEREIEAIQIMIESKIGF